MMELSPKQQAVELVKSAQRVLVLSHIDADGDAIGSLLALTIVLKKLKKEVTAAIDGNVPGPLQFLSHAETIGNDINVGKEFTISLDTAEVEIEKLGYKTLPEEKKLNIVITTKTGTLEPQNVNLGTGDTVYDLIIVLDSPDLDRLGMLYDKDPELYYTVPVVNIDHHPSNEYYGKVNWVDVTATSTAEMLVSFIEALAATGEESGPLVDPDVATALLTGLTTDTGSFQNANTTPKSLTVAAQLVGAGARQQEIVRNVFKTKPLTTLKLWGKALTKITAVPAGRFVYSTLSVADFDNAGASSEEASGVIDELIKSAPGIDFVMLVSERNGGVHGSLRATDKNVDVSTVARIFGGGGHEMAAAYHLENTTLEREMKRIVTKITDYQLKRLNNVATRSAMPSIIEETEEVTSDRDQIGEVADVTVVSAREANASELHTNEILPDRITPAAGEAQSQKPDTVTQPAANHSGSSKW